MSQPEPEFYDSAYRDAGWSTNLGQLVYVTRAGAGLTQTDLATAMGTSQSAIAAWESGARTPGVETLDRLARACGKRLHVSIEMP
ncbi:MAG TPA: helix-turn-helix transcriptional regulator [Mycobacterium sp.]|nr:helix-turn-helix transcriptional regulator [Mycobacterium sp.]